MYSDQHEVKEKLVELQEQMQVQIIPAISKALADISTLETIFQEDAKNVLRHQVISQIADRVQADLGVGYITAIVLLEDTVEEYLGVSI